MRIKRNVHTYSNHLNQSLHYYTYKGNLYNIHLHNSCIPTLPIPNPSIEYFQSSDCVFLSHISEYWGCGGVGVYIKRYCETIKHKFFASHSWHAVWLHNNPQHHYKPFILCINEYPPLPFIIYNNQGNLICPQIHKMKWRWRAPWVTWDKGYPYSP